MADIVKNHLFITGSVEEIKKFKSKTGEVFDLDKLLPSPEGADVNWCQENWGCKWNVENSVELSSTDTKLEYSFSTPWGPPEYGIERISNEFKGLHFELEFIEENKLFVGFIYIKNGKLFENFFERNEVEKLLTTKIVKKSSFLIKELTEG